MTVVVVGFGSSQNIEELGRYQDENAMPFVFTQGPDDMVRTFAVTTQSTKFGITRDGVIEFREGYGTSSGETWRERLRGLAGA